MATNGAQRRGGRRAKTSKTIEVFDGGDAHRLCMPPRLVGQVAYLPVRSLKGYRQNARRHPKRQVKLLGQSIRAFGFITPIIINGSGTIIAGHARALAADQEGLEYVPTISVTHLTPEEQRAFRLADNRLAELAEWDREVLARELDFLVEIDFELDSTGFEAPEIDFIIDEQLDDGHIGPADELPPWRENDPAVSQVGDLWALGEHRLLCGDARDPAAFDLLMGEDEAEMAFTDPPYNVEIDGNVCGLGSVTHDEFVMASGEMSDSEYDEFLDRTVRNLAAFSADGSLHYLCIDWRHQMMLQAICERHYSKQQNLCVWNKTNGGMGSFYRSQHELVLVYKNGTEPHINNIQLGKHGRNRSNVWTYPGANTFNADRRKELELHPTPKPVALVGDAMRDCSNRQGIVLDPFVGSGTTIIAAEETNRRCYAMELDPRYVDVAVRRWQSFTGKTAVHARSGKSFDQIAEGQSVGPLLLPPPSPNAEVDNG